MTVTINPDKTISIDGKKTFVVGMYTPCSTLTEDLYPCSQGIPDNKDFILHHMISSTAHYLSTILPLEQQNGTLFMRQSWDPIDPVIQSNPNFFGYLQCDEPMDGTETLYRTTEASCIAEVRCKTPAVWDAVNQKCYYGDERPNLAKYYSTWKTTDPSHVVTLNHWKNMTQWAPYCDILTWDNYPVGFGGWGITWTRDKAMYGYESMCEQNFFKGSDINSISNPVWAVLQGVGADYLSTPPAVLYPLTPAEVRCMTYSAICMDVKGIMYWSYIIRRGSSPNYYNVGLSANPVLHAYYAQIAREIKSINDALVSPTLAYKWSRRGLNPTTVTFNKNLTTVINLKTFENWSYILKQGSNSIWLIVVNKDVLPIPDVTISISGLVGNFIATIRGLETTGSGASGRTVSVTNGQFIDSFDGQAVHIYEISSEVLPLTGSLSIISDPPGASIELDGVLRPEITNIVLANLPTGSHNIKLSLPGYYDHMETVTIYDNQVTYVTANLSLIPLPPPPPPIELSTSDGLIKITIAGIAVATLYSWVNSQFKKK